MDQIQKLTREDKLKWWGEGEWLDEQDEVDFVYRGYDCKILRMKGYDGKRHDGSIHVWGGYLCGYVKIPKDHPLYGKNIFESHYDFDVHGGATFSQIPTWDDNFWIGFDCAHSYDIVPSMEYLEKHEPALIKIKKENEELFKLLNLERNSIFDKTYRNMNFAIEECKRLVDQISKIKKEG